MFLREVKIPWRDKEYRYWKVVESYRDKNTGKNRHKTIINLGQLIEQQVQQIRALLKIKTLGLNCFLTTLREIEVGRSYEFLNIFVLDHLYRMWKLDKIITNNGKTDLQVSVSTISEILTINRALCPNSDYRVCRWYPTTILPQLLNVSPQLVNPTRIYRCLDEVHLQEEDIQKHLFKMIPTLGFDTFSLIFYDITSTYFEGYRCPIARYGLSRDHRKDKPQVVLALAVTKEGFPFYWQVLSGEIHDSSTVKETVTALRERFKVEKVCLVMDKGMVNKDNFKAIEKENADNIYYLVTIPKTSFRKLASFPKKVLASIAEILEKEMERKEPDKIDYGRIMEGHPYFTYHSRRAYYHVLEEKDTSYRYILCFNPEKFVEERKQRAEKITSVEKRLEQWNKELTNAKKARNKERIAKEVFSYLEKRKVQGLFSTRVIKRKRDRKLQIKWKVNTEKLKLLKTTDGCYCIKTNLPQGPDITPEFLVSSYRQRRKIEVAFSYLKGFVDIRPLYHHKEERVKAHITICILGYLLQVTTEYLLKKAGFNISFQQFVSQLVTRRAVELEIAGMKKRQIRTPQIPEEIRKLVSAVSPELFTKIKEGTENGKNAL